MVFPAKIRWYFHIHHFIKKLNKTLIPQDFYAQIGRAVNTKSKYNEFLKVKNILDPENILCSDMSKRIFL
jgi:hypothetical protein